MATDPSQPLGYDEWERLLQAEREARAAAERAQARLALLAEAGDRLARSLDPRRTVDNLTRIVVPRLAEFCLIDLLEEGQLVRVGGAAHGETFASVLEHVRHRPPAQDSLHPSAVALRTGEVVFVPHLTEQHVGAMARDAAHAEQLRRLLGASVICSPLIARGRVLGVLALAAELGEEAYSPSDVEFAAELSRRAALAIDNALLYESQRHVAQALQQRLLPPGPLEAPGAAVAVRYVPAEGGIEVGGDFYDVVVTGNRRWAMAVGDVGGKGVEAAAVMGQLRTAVRAYALEGHQPAGILRRLDTLFAMMAASDFSTCVVATYNPDTRELTWSNAGHPPPLLRRRTGEVEWLEALVGLPLGLGGAGQEQRRIVLDPGDVLVLYTDGLVERRGVSIDDGLGKLSTAASAAPAQAESLADSVIRELLRGAAPPDDVALLVCEAT